MNYGYIDGYMHKAANRAKFLSSLVKGTAETAKGIKLPKYPFKTPPTRSSDAVRAGIKTAKPTKIDSVKNLPEYTPSARTKAFDARDRKEVGSLISDGKVLSPKPLSNNLKALDPGRKASAAAQEAKDYARYQSGRIQSAGAGADPATLNMRLSRHAAELKKAKDLSRKALTQRATAGAGVAGAGAVSMGSMGDAKGNDPTMAEGPIPEGADTATGGAWPAMTRKLFGPRSAKPTNNKRFR